MTFEQRLAAEAVHQGDGTYIPVIKAKDGKAEWGLLNIDELRENG